MKNLEAYNLSIGAAIWRFYLMMAVVLIAGFSGYWLIGFLALPIFLSIMMGTKFNFKMPQQKTNKTKKRNGFSLPTTNVKELA